VPASGGSTSRYGPPVNWGRNMRGLQAIVVGGSFKGLVAARRLVSLGATVTIVEKSTRLGGIHMSIPWDGFQLDLGCHFFGNDDKDTTALLLDLMREAPNPVTPALRSCLNGQFADGIEYPDFTLLDPAEHGPALVELLEYAAARGASALPEPSLDRNLDAYLTQRYGPRTAALLDAALGKMTLARARELSAACFTALSARRVKMTSDATAEQLKKNPAFDDVILHSGLGDPMRFYRDAAAGFDARCFYPAQGGMGGFAANATLRLEELGVSVRTGSAIDTLSLKNGEASLTLENGETLTGDVLVWSSGAEALGAALGLDLDLAAQIHGVPMALYYYDVPRDAVGPYSWVHDFDRDHLLFRASAPSCHGDGTAPDGRAYVVAEVPVSLHSDVYANPQRHDARVWDEIVTFGVAEGPLPEHRRTMTVPVSYRFPKAGFASAARPLFARLAMASQIVLLDEWTFGKAASVRDVDARLADFQSTRHLKTGSAVL
jgi:protoporphyrinogen oxidase